MFAVFLAVCSLAAVKKSPFVGMWQGKRNNLPSVELKIDAVEGRLRGVVIFSFQERKDDASWHVESKVAEPLLAPRAEGRILTFEARQKTHGGPEFGQNVRFEMELTGRNQAILRKIGEQPASTPLRLSRRK
jgi:hypothetical protein